MNGEGGGTMWMRGRCLREAGRMERQSVANSRGLARSWRAFGGWTGWLSAGAGRGDY